MKSPVTTTLQAFHNRPTVKSRFLSRVKAHQKADELIRGDYWKGGRGCAIGCTIHSSDHSTYERALGIPEWMAYAEDVIFEGVHLAKSHDWPRAFLEAIPVGFDSWNHLYHDLCAFVLRDIAQFDRTRHPALAVAIDRLIALHSSWDDSPAIDAAALEAINVARRSCHDPEAWLAAIASVETTSPHGISSMIKWAAESAGESKRSPKAESDSYDSMAAWLLARLQR